MVAMHINKNTFYLVKDVIVSNENNNFIIKTISTL